VSALAAKQATTDIPIVFASGGDALRLGLVKSMNRPDGNVTGVNLFFGALGGKQIELLRAMVPKADDIAMLANPANPTSESDIAEVSRAASTIGARIRVCLATNPPEIDRVLSGLKERSIEGALIGDDPFLFSRREQIVGKLTAQAIPAVYFAREFVAAGGLISYGASLVGGYRQVGLYVGALLKGAKVSELPVIQPNTFTLAVNLRAARAIGLTIPVSVLVAADEVIE
jgi:putative ABC transport system substrate-binding protein